MPNELTYTDEEIEQKLNKFFEENYEILRLEGGNHLAPEALQTAREQVMLYWRKLKDVAKKVTETEVKLTLSDQITPSGRKYSIDGVVDIVSEDGRTTMYDLKTHEASYVRDNIDHYQPQLNVYAHIWHNLRGEPLDEAAIITTEVPEQLRNAVRNRESSEVIDKLLDDWDPVITVPFDGNQVDDTIQKFAAVVDKIEDHKFKPPSVKRLKQTVHRGRRTGAFGRDVCRNCDARFSCSSYRKYSAQGGTVSERSFRTYFADDIGEDEQNERLTAGIEATEALSVAVADDLKD